MAEINVEKKKPVWPWIIGIIAILLAIILLFIFVDNNDDDDTTEDSQIEKVDQFERQENTDLSYPENPIGAYLQHIDEGYEEELGEEERFTREAIGKLADAVEQQALELRDTPGEELQQVADRYGYERRERPGDQTQTRDTAATGQSIQAEELKRSGEIIVNSLEELQQTHFPDLSGEIQALRSDLDAINADTPNEEQSEEITSFFTQAAEVLRNMPVDTGGTTVPADPARDTARYSTDVDTIDLE